MSNPSIAPPGRNGPWRILFLDRDPDDPKWILATVASPRDVQPARSGDAGLDELTAAYLAARHGLARAALTPLPGALAWRVDEPGRPSAGGPGTRPGHGG
jgi:hypothetical protein